MVLESTRSVFCPSVDFGRFYLQFAKRKIDFKAGFQVDAMLRKVFKMVLIR